MTKEEFSTLKDSKKFRYIIATIVTVLSIILFIIGFFLKFEYKHYVANWEIEINIVSFAQWLFNMGSSKDTELLANILLLVLLGIIIISSVLRYVSIYTEFKFLIAFQIIFGLGVLPVSMLLAFLCDLYMTAPVWIMFAAGLMSSLGAILVNGIIATVLFLPGKTKEFFKKCAHFFAAITNFHYKGKAPIGYFGKIMEVFVQIMLLPISAIIQVLFVPYSVMGFFYFGQLIIKHMFYLELKGEKDDRIEIRGEAEERVVKKTVEHDIRNVDGVKIGTYESVDDCVEYYGGSYVIDNQMEDALKNGFVVLPLRIVSLLLSIIALFIPKMYVKVTRPKCEHRFKYSYFRYLDLIIFE